MYASDPGLAEAGKWITMSVGCCISVSLLRGINKSTQTAKRNLLGYKDGIHRELGFPSDDTSPRSTERSGGVLLIRNP